MTLAPAGPVLHSGRRTRTVMAKVVAALAPACGAAVWRHGEAAVALLALSVGAAWALDALCDRRQAGDGSAVVAGLLVALMMPVTARWWAAVGASALAIVVGKHAFGGLGRNPFNPAAAGLAGMMFVAPTAFLRPRWEVDGATFATPLAADLGAAAPAWRSLVAGDATVALGEAAPLAVIGGGIALVAFRLVDLRLPLVYLASIAVLALILPPGARMEGHAPWLGGNPLLHLLGGGTLLGAFFLVTDPATSPFTRGGRLIFCALAAGAAMAVRYATPYPDGVALGVLFANACVPFIDRATVGRPRRR